MFFGWPFQMTQSFASSLTRDAGSVVADVVVVVVASSTLQQRRLSVVDVNAVVDVVAAGVRPLLQEVGDHVALALDPDGAAAGQLVALRLKDLGHLLCHLKS